MTDTVPASRTETLTGTAHPDSLKHDHASSLGAADKAVTPETAALPTGMRVSRVAQRYNRLLMLDFWLALCYQYVPLLYYDTLQLVSRLSKKCWASSLQFSSVRSH